MKFKKLYRRNNISEGDLNLDVECVVNKSTTENNSEVDMRMEIDCVFVVWTCVLIIYLSTEIVFVL